jgi:probable rRNA maturation factor
MSSGFHPARFHLELSLIAEVGPPDGIDESDLARIAAFVLESEDAGGHWEITFVLVDDARLQALHRDFMGIDSPTDIMTFPVEETDRTMHGGDIVISIDQAIAHAEDTGTSPAEEVRFLLVHGLLHLLGWRDERDEDRRTMLARQRAILDEISQIEPA